MKDALLTFSTAQAVTTQGDAVSTDYVDQLSYGDALGKPCYLVFRVDTSATSAGAGTVAFVLQCDDNSSFSSPTDVYVSAVTAKTVLVAGYSVQVPLPTGLERYLRVVYRIATADLTAGKFDAYITDSIATRVK